MNTSKISATQTALRDAALKVQENAYAPYSNFKVGAAILASNGKIYAGCNVENAAYPLGTCAEGGAISAMIADGATSINEVFIVGSADQACYPCGGCRQKLAEFSQPEVKVTMQSHSGQYEILTVGELLPASFSLN
ncbi:cytidine deaminase [Alteromonas facilis]|uniref:cytidine deaminase n=1 Tax=Alteromonas facilis TaxID=2048004 RepID=UPI000C292D44|nr:cytidine deaminase [Alteromonas facilis]